MSVLWSGHALGSFASVGKGVSRPVSDSVCTSPADPAVHGWLPPGTGRLACGCNGSISAGTGRLTAENATVLYGWCCAFQQAVPTALETCVKPRAARRDRSGDPSGLYSSAPVKGWSEAGMIRADRSGSKSDGSNGTIGRRIRW